jgi:hypothetical protein
LARRDVDRLNVLKSWQLKKFRIEHGDFVDHKVSARHPIIGFQVKPQRNRLYWERPTAPRMHPR